jgi:hypothetical protein
MADDIDRANDQAQAILELQLRQRKPTLPHNGKCHFCEDDITTGAFCSAECRDDFEKQEQARRRNGRPNEA